MTRRKLIPLAVVALVALAILAVLAPSFYEVEQKGHDLLPYDSGLVYKVRVADAVTIYADGESSPKPDLFTGVGLAVVATAALMSFLLLSAAGARERLRRFYLLSAIGLGFLAADELLGIHETVGHNLRFLADVPGVERPDDLIILLYAIPAVGFLILFRDVLLASSRARLLFGLGLVLFVASALSDIAAGALEEPLKFASAGCILAGLGTLMAEHLSTGLGLGPAGAPQHEPRSRPREAPVRAGAPSG